MVRDDKVNSGVLNPPEDPPRLSILETHPGWGDLRPPGSGFVLFGGNEGEKAEAEPGD